MSSKKSKRSDNKTSIDDVTSAVVTPVDNNNNNVAVQTSETTFVNGDSEPITPPRTRLVREGLQPPEAPKKAKRKADNLSNELDISSVKPKSLNFDTLNQTTSSVSSESNASNTTNTVGTQTHAIRTEEQFWEYMNSLDRGHTNGSKVTSCVTLYDPSYMGGGLVDNNNNNVITGGSASGSSLSSEATATPHNLSWETVIGADSYKQFLVDHIAKPLVCAQHYEGSGGVNPIHKVLAVYGADGSGRYTVLREFCKHFSIKLIEMHSPYNWVGIDDIISTYTYALKNTPSIVFIRKCEILMNRERANPAFVHMIHAITNHLKTLPNYKVWTIFCTGAFSDNSKDIVYRLVDKLVYVNPLDSEANVGRMIEMAASKYLIQYNRNVKDLIGEDLFRELCHIGLDHTPREVMNYIARVFEHLLISIDLGKLKKMRAGDLQILPNKQTFLKFVFNIGSREIANEPPRLTRNTRPRDTNILPFNHLLRYD